jgi:RNA polymerase sigma factor (sigma-70 family)
MDQKAISKQIISDFIGGSEQAFTKIYWAYFPGALLLGQRLFHDRELAKDFVQDLFVRVWEKREKFKDVEDVSNYIYGMAWKLAADKQSKATVRLRLLQKYFVERTQPNSIELEFQYTDNEYKQIIERAIASAPPRGQRIFKLREQGLSQSQIAKEMNLAQGTVDNELSSAMKAIKTYIKSHAISIVAIQCASYLLAL